MVSPIKLTLIKAAPILLEFRLLTKNPQDHLDPMTDEISLRTWDL